MNTVSDCTDTPSDELRAEYLAAHHRGLHLFRRRRHADNAGKAELLALIDQEECQLEADRLAMFNELRSRGEEVPWLS